ncbi:DNA-binding transcriptional regulator YhcF (GntR family) [Nakamurella sp. UYEF19]|uniref:GntR family transcriptional regulator n=1 Tax=Nakamurella sp. UYEF19 TaxID=1756392 RepID=UPI003391BFEF
MTVRLAVDVTAATPVYEQLRAQIAGHIGAGSLRTGDRLPTVRGLAAELDIAVNTVGRAYAELESAGLVSTGRRVGTVVTGRPAAVVGPEISLAAEVLATLVTAQGVPDDTAVEILRHALRQSRVQPPLS